MDIEQLRPHLWRWTATHPDWSPEEGGPDRWEPEVSCHALVEEDALVLDRSARPLRRRRAVLAGARRDVEHRGPDRRSCSRGTGTHAARRRSSTAIQARASGYPSLRRRKRASGSSSPTHSPQGTRCREGSNRRRPTTRPRCCSGSRRSVLLQRATFCSARPEAASVSAPTPGSQRESRLRRSATSCARCFSTCRSSSFSWPTGSRYARTPTPQLAAALTA